jgi:phage baseplate assembly protein gpV
MSQQNKTTLQSAINTQIADNTSGDISAADIRDNLINITDSLLFNTGSGQAITGSLIVTGGITGSLQGTATTASYVQTAQTASFLNVGTYSITSSWAVSASQALTASRATSASYALSASYAPTVASNPFPFTGSAVISGSLTITGSINSTGSVILGRPDFLGNRNLNISFNNENEAVSLGAGLGINSKTNRISFDTITGTSNIAATSSIGLFAPTTNIVSPITNITGSAIVSGSLGVTGSVVVNTGDINVLSPSTTNKISVTDGTVRNEFKKTSTQMINGTYALGSFVYDPANSPFFPLSNAIYSNGATNLLISSEQKLNIEATSTEITGSLRVTGSTSLNGLMTLQPANPLPSVTNGSIAYSSSGDFYFGSGSAWRKLTL